MAFISKAEIVAISLLFLSGRKQKIKYNYGFPYAYSNFLHHWHVNFTPIEIRLMDSRN